MAVYSVFTNATKSPDDVVFVAQGFSWPAFFFSVPWCVWHRLWMAATIVAALLVLFGSLFDATAALILTLAAVLALGFCAGELRRWALLARGYNESQIVSGGTREEAELRYFLSASEPISTSQETVAKPMNLTHHEPLGLFGSGV